MPYTAVENPIYLWFTDDNVMEYYGKEMAIAKAQSCLEEIKLDPEEDDPLPDWAIDLLLMSRISYRGRVRIALAHCQNIIKRIRKEVKARKEELDGR